MSTRMLSVRCSTLPATGRRYVSSKPLASEVLTAYLTQCNEPPWTSYFVKPDTSQEVANMAPSSVRITRTEIDLTKMEKSIAPKLDRLYLFQYSSVKDDQRGRSNFNWRVGTSNYQILRTGCFPYIKYHCSKRHAEDLTLSDKLMWCVKTFNLGIPCLLYGLAAIHFISHEENVKTARGAVTIYFLLPEHKGSPV